MRTAAFAILTIVIVHSSSPAQDDQVVLKVGKIGDLMKYIESQKGKVVVVDFWADYCVPCKREFPHLVKLHNAHAKEGLIAVSACVDAVEDKEASLEFLKEKKATFFNILIDEDAEVWQKQFGFDAVPAVLVFGRDGTLARKFTLDDPKNQFTYADVEKFVKPLLEKK